MGEIYFWFNGYGWWFGEPGTEDAKLLHGPFPSYDEAVAKWTESWNG